MADPTPRPTARPLAASGRVSTRERRVAVSSTTVTVMPARLTPSSCPSVPRGSASSARRTPRPARPLGQLGLDRLPPLRGACSSPLCSPRIVGTSPACCPPARARGLAPGVRPAAADATDSARTMTRTVARRTTRTACGGPASSTRDPAPRLAVERLDRADFAEYRADEAHRRGRGGAAGPPSSSSGCRPAPTTAS